MGIFSKKPASVPSKPKAPASKSDKVETQSKKHKPDEKVSPKKKPPEDKYFGSKNQPLYLFLLIVILGILLKFLSGE